jgi:hypothetical protein
MGFDAGMSMVFFFFCFEATTTPPSAWVAVVEDAVVISVNVAVRFPVLPDPF